MSSRYGQFRRLSDSWDPSEGERPGLPSDFWDPNPSRSFNQAHVPDAAYQTSPRDVYPSFQHQKPTLQTRVSYQPVNGPDDDDIPLVSREQWVPSQAIQAGESWQPGFWERAPGWGLSALLGSFVCERGASSKKRIDTDGSGTIAAVIVLLASDGKATAHWASGLQPTVFLSIATALANLLLTFALSQGLVIAFWTRALAGSNVSI